MTHWLKSHQKTKRKAKRKANATARSLNARPNTATAWRMVTNATIAAAVQTARTNNSESSWVTNDLFPNLFIHKFLLIHHNDFPWKLMTNLFKKTIFIIPLKIA